MPELLPVAVFFLLSLGGAWVLFKWLSSTAVITNKQYQLGGAAAGCLIIFWALYGAYNHLMGLKLEALQAQLNDCQAQRDADEHEVHIVGTVSPVLKNATVTLAVKTVKLGGDGRFGLTWKGLDLKRDSIDLYVAGETEHGLLQQYYPLLAGDDTENLKLKLELQ